jgi:hypothetical protein
MTTEVPKPKVGEMIHFLKSGLIFHRVTGSRLTADVSSRGQEYVLTTGDLENSDRDGGCFWDLVNDPERQIARWGEVVVSSGPAPEHFSRSSPRWRPEGPAEADEERQRRRAVADRITDPEERREAQVEIDRVLGRANTSKTLNTYGSR